MNYKETLDFLFSQLPMYQRSGAVAYKANLDNTKKLDAYFGQPHEQFKSIHVAGTNGKGSVSHCLASVLQEAGYKVGLYTSPHLKDFRERIKINGLCISEEDVVDFVTDHKKIIEEIKPSFFEMTVAMAFKYFADCKVDIAIVEVGLGGRLDSTNIITPECSVITNIGLDHTALLGDNLGAIAIEKAGVIKPNIPVVIGAIHSETKNVFIEKANAGNSEIRFAEEIYSSPVVMNGIDARQIFQVYKDGKLEFENLKLDLLGHYQKKNLITVLTVLDVMIANGYAITSKDIYNGLCDVVKNTGLMGRWQVLGANPQIICDTGHNKEGVEELMQQLLSTAFDKLHIVWGMVNDKDVDNVLKLLPKDATYYFARPNIPRGLDAVELQSSAKKYGLMGKVYDSVDEAKKGAKKNASHNDLIFIGGSTFVVAEVV